jgi:MinD superfamily P-loop ATPase
MKINILSGKGGVGKTSISASLASLLSKEFNVVAVDCDVDAPNFGLCFGLTADDFEKEKISTTEQAELIVDRCSECGECLDSCAFDAISWNDGPEFNPFLCEGCGTCQIVCPSDAIQLRKVENGWIGTTNGDFPIVGGQLKVGQAGSGEIVELLKHKAERIEHEVMIVDSAAGIGCPVIASVKGCDYVIAVTEPTPSALSDLKRVLEVVRHFGIDYGIVINKSDIYPEYNDQVRDLALEWGVPVLGEIPYDKSFVDALVNFSPPVVYNPKLKPFFVKIIENMSLYIRSQVM